MEQEREASRQDTAAPIVDRAKLESGEGAGVPEAVRAAALVRADAENPVLSRTGRGVEWVRPSDLLARHAATLSGRGIDFQAELARRARAPMTIRQQVADRERRLPQLAAFGRGSPTYAGPGRSGVGMS